jgi:hypothetical protein
MAHRSRPRLVASTVFAVLLISTTSTHAQSRSRTVSPQEQVRWNSVIETSGLLPFLTGLTWHKRGFYAQVKDVGAFAAYLESRLHTARDGIFRRGFLHGRHKDIGPGRLDYRSNRGTLGAGSLQVVFSTLTGKVFIDMDEFNPYEDVTSFLGHALEVCGNRLRAGRQ